jgi:hypothetical protein
VRRIVLLFGALLTALALGAPGVDAPRPAAADPGTAPTLGHVGDSIPFQAFFHYDITFKRDRQVVFSSVGLAYKIRRVLPDIRAAFARGDVPDIFLSFIGTSASQSDPPHVWARELKQMLDLVSPRVDCIRVFEIDDDRTGFYTGHDRNAREYNRITHAIVNRYPNAEWFHYERWAALAGPEFERRDVLHHNVRGQVEIARLMQEAVNGCDPALNSGPFWDVPDRHPASAAIRWVGDNGIFNGYPNHTYRASIGSFTLNATRGDLINMAWRQAGRPAGYPNHPWSDGRAVVNRALRWSAATRVMSGLPGGRFGVGTTVTRGQAVTLLWRMAGFPTGYPDDPWSDATGKAYRWAAETNVLGGLPGGVFRPRSPLTRAQAATILYRYENLPD